MKGNQYSVVEFMAFESFPFTPLPRDTTGASLEVQWLRPTCFNARGMAQIPNIPRAEQPKEKKYENRAVSLPWVLSPIFVG